MVSAWTLLFISHFEGKKSGEYSMHGPFGKHQDVTNMELWPIPYMNHLGNIEI